MKPTDETLAHFAEALERVDNLAKCLAKDSMIDIARVLALHIAQYRRLYGDLDDQMPVKPHCSSSVNDENELLMMACEGLDYLAETMLYALEQEKLKQNPESTLH